MNKKKTINIGRPCTNGTSIALVLGIHDGCNGEVCELQWVRTTHWIRKIGMKVYVFVSTLKKISK